MRTRTKTAYVLTFTSTVAFIIGWVIPFWFGRFYENTRSKKQWGLFYVIDCRPGNCTSTAGVLRNENVDFGGTDCPVRLEAISALATLTLITCLLGFGIVMVFHCHACGKRYSYHNYVTSACIVQFIAAIFAFFTIILTAISNGFFFSKFPLDDIIEFPWALLSFCVGEVLLIASAILYLLITCHWKRYRHIYARKRYVLEYPHQRFYRYNEPLPDYTLDHKHRYKPYNRDSFVGYYRGRHDDGRSSRKKSWTDDELYIQDRNPWEKRRNYYTFPNNYRSAFYDDPQRVFNSAFGTMGNGYRTKTYERYTEPSYFSKSRVWHTAGSWWDPPKGRRDRYRDVYM
ncbi:hypothetical protein ACF0H5_001548 [Mactra antiquata]